MVRNNKRRAFTIVELVIVIAVIAILAAVMIPTFGGIIKKANISADTQIAASMNTQLSIYTAEGKKIETEADLWKALSSDADFTGQLDPKSAKHGYHYWYNAEKNEIKLLSNEQVLTERTQPAMNADPEGNVATPFAYAAPRLINGFYLLDKAGEGSTNDIANFFKVLDGAAELGDAYIEALDALKAITGDNQNLAATIAAKMLKTVVVSNNGVYYHAETTADANYYFLNGITTIKATHHVFGGESNGKLPTPANNQLVLPSTVKSVEKDALNFATANSVTVVTSYADSDVLAAALAAGCSNAIFTTTEGNAYIVEEYYNETKKENVDALFQYNPNGDNSWKCDLKKRLPFSDFTIQSNHADNLYTLRGDTVYVLITQQNKAYLEAQDVTNQGNKSSEIDLWESNNDNIWVNSDGSIDFRANLLDSTGYTATITATAINDKLETVVKTINVEIVRATSATVVINGQKYVLGEDQDVTLQYSNGITYDVTLHKGEDGNGGASYSVSGFGTNSITVAAPTGGMVSVANGKTLSFDTSKLEDSFTVSVDDCLTTTFHVNLENTDLADYQHTFNVPTDTTERPFYIGEGNPIKLSSFLELKEGRTFDNVTITIYDELDGVKLHNSNEINKTNNGIGATISYTNVANAQNAWYITSKTIWDEATIQFNIDEQYFKDDALEGEEVIIPDYYDVYVQVTDGENYSTKVNIRILKDANNVTSETLATTSGNIVLHGNVTIPENATTKINLENRTLYGNGYIIQALKYQGNKTKNDYFIQLNNGTLDNIYIDGPVYPEFDYNTGTTGYHVSGIVATGNSTVQNSYVSNFRQPIALNSGTLNVTNTTLYGGNYANLQVNGGTLNLHNVTTVQPESGLNDTFDKNKKVIGLGIVVEYAAINNNQSAINVTGYLDQYNWLSYEGVKDLTLPEFAVNGVNLDFKNVLAGMFNGLDITITFLGSPVYSTPEPIRLNFLDKYFYTANGAQYIIGTSTGPKYLNTGVIFLTLGNEASTAKTNIETNFTLTDGRTAGDKKFSRQGNIPLFSEYDVLSKSIKGYEINITANLAMGLLEDMKVDNSGILNGTFGVTKVAGSALTKSLDVFIDFWGYKPNSTGTDAVTVGAQFSQSDNYYASSDYYSTYFN